MFVFLGLVITNGYFTRDRACIREVAEGLRECGVNEVLLSVDAFHQEAIPLECVREFATDIMRAGIPLRLQPAWLVGENDDNEYNLKTREILSRMKDTGAVIGEGNVIFPEGNARIFLAEYFKEKSPENPYIEDPCRVKCLSIEPNGDLLGKNLHDMGIEEILTGYTPEA